MSFLERVFLSALITRRIVIIRSQRFAGRANHADGWFTLPLGVAVLLRLVPQYMRARKRGRYISLNTHIAKHKLSAAYRGAYIPDRGPYL